MDFHFFFLVFGLLLFSLPHTFLQVFFKKKFLPLYFTENLFVLLILLKILRTTPTYCISFPWCLLGKKHCMHASIFGIHFLYFILLFPFSPFPKNSMAHLAAPRISTILEPDESTLPMDAFNGGICVFNTIIKVIQCWVTPQFIHITKTLEIKSFINDALR